VSVLAVTLRIVKRSYVLGFGGIFLLASCMAPPTATGPEPSAPTHATHVPAQHASPAGPTRSASPHPPAAGSALAALARIPVKGRAPKTGYARAQFGKAWDDENDDPMGHDGCDTRDDILARDLRGLTFRSDGCKVATGTLHDPYTGASVPFVRGPGTSSLVQIDHVVPLSNAWQTGAQSWTARQRLDFANDPLELIPTRGAVNEEKGDGDAATWLPPKKPFRCAYAARMVAIKLKWHLWVTPPEHAALARLLGACPGQALPVEPGAV
jgi:hypothetical protein